MTKKGCSELSYGNNKNEMNGWEGGRLLETRNCSRFEPRWNSQQVENWWIKPSKRCY